MTFEAGNMPRTGETYPTELIPADKIRLLLDQCGLTPKGRKTNSITGLRDRTLITLFWRTGIRHAEALSLEPKDLDFPRRLIAVRDGKGEKTGTLGMDELTLITLRDWKEAYKGLGAPKGSPLLCTIKHGIGKTLDQSSVCRMMRTRAERAGIEQRLIPHNLRHTLAVEMALEECSLYEIQQVLRHENAATTQKYLTKLYPDLGIKALQRRD